MLFLGDSILYSRCIASAQGRDPRILIKLSVTLMSQGPIHQEFIYISPSQLHKSYAEVDFTQNLF